MPEDSALVDRLIELGLLQRGGDGRLTVLDPALLTAGLQVVELGVPPEELIAAQARVNEHVREIARTYVQMFVDTGWRAFLEAGAPPEEFERVQATVARLQPVAAQAVLAAFRTEMALPWGPPSRRRSVSSRRRSRDLLPLERLPLSLLRSLPGAEPPVADDRADDECDQQRGRHEEADRADDAEAVESNHVVAGGHPSM